MTNEQVQPAALPCDIARDIVCRFPWTTNVWFGGHIVSLGVAVEKAIADAIVADRERIAASRVTPADPALDPATVEAVLAVMQKYPNRDLPCHFVVHEIRALASGEKK